MGVVTFGIPQDVAFWFKNTFGLQRFVETGTFRGDTTAWASQHFERVMTVEGSAELHAAAVRRFADQSRVECLLGSSATVLPGLVAALTEPALFWLDAHWCMSDFTHGAKAECPLVAEISAFSHTQLPHVLFIDDARLFLAPPPKPHDYSHWPGLSEICRALDALPLRRFLLHVDDILIAAPESDRAQIVDFIREREQRMLQSRPPRSLVQRAVGRVAKKLGAI